MTARPSPQPPAREADVSLTGPVRQELAVPALVAAHPLPVPSAPAGAPVAPHPGGGPLAPVEPVRITIGRVEVRAVFPAPQPRASARSAPPSLPLDDYLRKRGRS